MIYFIQTVNNPDGPVKIGYSKNPKKRLSGLQSGSPEPLHIIEMIKGKRDDEKRLHLYFKSLRLHGKWFSFEGNLKTLLEDKKFQEEILTIIPQLEVEYVSVAVDLDFDTYNVLCEFANWQTNGNISEMLRRVVNFSIEKEEENLDEFIDACCFLGDNYETKFDVLYDAYIKWLAGNPMSRILFDKQMSKRFKRMKRKNPRYYRGREVYYIGICGN